MNFEVGNTLMLNTSPESTIVLTDISQMALKFIAMIP